MKGIHRRARFVVGVVVLAAVVFAPSAMATSTVDASKSATGHWTRTFQWTIDKSVTPASHAMQTGESGTSTYTIALTKSGGTDAVWVDGSVCVTNTSTGDTENLTITDRVQVNTGSGFTPGAFIATAPVSTSANPVLSPGESHCYPYSISLTAVAGAVGYRNNAAVRVTNDPRCSDGDPTTAPGCDPGDPFGPNVTADFNLPATPTLINNSVNVDDTNNAGDAGPFTGSTSYSYTRTFRCDQDAGTHNNVATIVETGQSDNAVVTVTCTPLTGFCHETVNPSGNPGVGDNGYPDDPFGGDAVPGGTSTTPGSNGNGPINPDGFYLVGGRLYSDTTPIAYPGGGFVWPANTTIKYTERGNPQIRITSNIGGPNSVIQYHVQAPGDLYVGAPKGAAGAIFCGVPPPPH